jgi:hypothetical protein
MLIPPDATIADDKIARYLLVWRPVGDKSKFLAKAGFSVARPNELRDAIRELASHAPAIQDGISAYGTFWRVEGILKGPRRGVEIVAIWLQWRINGSFHFVTLKPWSG